MFEFEGDYFSALAINNDKDLVLEWCKQDLRVAEVQFRTLKSFKHVNSHDNHQFISWQT